MMRFVIVLGIACLVGLAAFVYRIKYESLALSREMQQLQRDIDIERDAVAALKAQFSALAKPSRLQGLAERHLKHLKPFSVTQLAALSEIPERAPDLGAFIDKLPAGAGVPVVDSELGSPTGAERKPIRAPKPKAPESNAAAAARKILRPNP